MDAAAQTCKVLDRIVRDGGMIAESMLPQDNDLVMFRLKQQQFISPVGTFTDSGELIFGITDKGVAELERHKSRTWH